MQLRARAASLIRPGFPDRVMRAIRVRSSPLLVTHFALCAAVAALCLVAVAIYRARLSTDENDQNLAGWSEISAQADEFGQGL